MPRRSSKSNIIADLYFYGAGIILDKCGERAASTKRLAVLAKSISEFPSFTVFYPAEGLDRRYTWGGPTGVKQAIGDDIVQKGNSLRLSREGKARFKQFLLAAGTTTLRRKHEEREQFEGTDSQPVSGVPDAG